MSRRAAGRTRAGAAARGRHPGAGDRLDQHPHQFSGGMRQRVVIALACAGEPALIVADEPTTALDVSVQAQITALLKRICREHGTAVLLVTHDMGVIAETADRVAVMYAGRLAEIGPVDEVIRRPLHPYTSGPDRLDPEPASPGGSPGPDRRRDAAARRDAKLAAASTRAACSGVRTLPHRAAGLAGPGPSAAACWLQATDDRHAPGSRHRARGRPGCAAGTTCRRRGSSGRWPDRRAADAEGGRRCQFHRAARDHLRLVGESGCGKSTLAKLVTACSGRPPAQVRFAAGSGGDGRMRVQMIFQDPYASLNPRWTVGDIVAEPIRTLACACAEPRRSGRVDKLLGQVGLGRSDAAKYPHAVLGRPAPANLDRPRAGDRARVPGAGRADLRARRLGPGAGPEPDGRAAGGSSA